MSNRIWNLEYNKNVGYYTVEEKVTLKSKKSPEVQLLSSPSLDDCLDENLGTVADVKVAKTPSDSLVIKLGESLKTAEFAAVNNGPYRGRRLNHKGPVIDKTGIRIFSGLRRGVKRDERESIAPKKMFKVSATEKEIKIKCTEPLHKNADKAKHTVFKFDLFLCDKGTKVPLVNGWIDPVIRNDGGGGENN